MVDKIKKNILYNIDMAKKLDLFYFKKHSEFTLFSLTGSLVLANLLIIGIKV